MNNIKKLISFTILIICLSSISYAQEIKVNSYSQGDWNKLTALASEKPLIVHFWGVTCAPCLTEMPQWGKFVAENKKFQIIFIQVDDVSKQKMARFLIRAHLESAENYALTDFFDERIRYEVDPKWQGETPVTFLISKNNQKTRITGQVNFQNLKLWYVKNV